MHAPPVQPPSANTAADSVGYRSVFDDAFLRRLERLPFLVNTPARGPRAGERIHARTGAGLEFSDYRPYHPGDDVRHVDWNVSARLDQLFLKRYASELDTSVHVLLDISTSMAFGTVSKLDYGRQLAAALAVIALSNRDRFALSVFHQTRDHALPYLKGKHHLHTVLRFLSEIDTADAQTTNPGTAVETTTPGRNGGGFVDTFNEVVGNRASPGVLVLISDLLGDSDIAAALRALRSRQLDVIVVQLLTDEELSPALDGVLKLIDSETGEDIRTTVDAALLAQYLAQLHAHLNTVEATCRQAGFRYLRSSTSVALEALILRDLGSPRRRAGAP
ncbi:MAG: DUF58 domain-containing protein [Pseudomonadota bacterium]